MARRPVATAQPLPLAYHWIDLLGHTIATGVAEQQQHHIYDWWMDLWMEAGGPYYIRLQLSDGSYRLNGFSDSSCYRLGSFFVDTIKLNPELYYAWAVDPDQHELRIEHVLITKTDSTVTINFDPSSPDYSIHLDRSNYSNLLIAWRDFISRSLPEDIAIMRRKNHFFFQIPCDSSVTYNRRV